jgi:RND superfamily putative drug exporter
MAVAIDATIVRTVIVPSAMTLTGRACWYLPRWLEWLPRVRVDEAGASVDVETDAGGGPAVPTQEAARP